MVLPNSDKAPRTPPYSGARSKEGQLDFAYAAIMLYGETFQNSSATDWLCNFPGRLPPSQSESHDPLKATPAGLALSGFRLFRVRSPLLAESLLFSFPPGTEMVHFPGFALTALCVQAAVTSYKLAGFPHSEIKGSRVVCTSPWLIAAYHVLHRLHAPRHPPCALSSLTIKFAHRKLDQHIRSLTPSSSEATHFGRIESILGILPIRLSKSTKTLIVY